MASVCVGAVAEAASAGKTRCCDNLNEGAYQSLLSGIAYQSSIPGLEPGSDVNVSDLCCWRDIRVCMRAVGNEGLRNQKGYWFLVLFGDAQAIGPRLRSRDA